MTEDRHRPICELDDRIEDCLPVYFPRHEGSRISCEFYSSPEIYELEQERIFRGPAWSFVALEAKLPSSGFQAWADLELKPVEIGTIVAVGDPGIMRRSAKAVAGRDAFKRIKPKQAI